MSSPSEKALKAAAEAYAAGAMRYTVMTGPEDNLQRVHELKMGDAMAAAHDPALGLNRSVCLRDVVEFVRDHENNFGTAFEDNVEEVLEHEFGGGA